MVRALPDDDTASPFLEQRCCIVSVKRQRAGAVLVIVAADAVTTG